MINSENPTPPQQPTDIQPGPYESTSRTTYKFAPFEFSTTKEFKSSHVPPPAPCGCHDGESTGTSNADVIDAIMKMGSLIISQFQAAAASSSSQTAPNPSAS